MTEGNAPKTSINKTYELDVDDIGSVPHCPEIQKQTDERYLYSAPYQTEPVYESPLCLELNANTTQRRESAEGKGRRSKRNDIYETTNDEALPNGRCDTGYSYVTNTGNVISRFAYDNPVRATSGDVDHEYEESFRNSRSSKNVVYDDIDSPKTLTIQGIRDTKTGAPSRYSCGNGARKQRANCVQIFTLLLSILACIIGILAFLVASGNVKLKDVENEPVNPPAQLKGEQPTVGGDREQLGDMRDDYARMKKQVESSKQNYTELMAKYNELSEQVTSSKQDYAELMAKYNNITGQYENVDSNVLSLKDKLNEFSSELVGVVNVSQQLNNTLESINSKFAAQLTNISKQMGPRGFNGTQGPQGPQGLPGLQGPKGVQGVGNLSACIVDEKVVHGTLAFDSGKVTVSYGQRPGWKVMSAVCSTRVDAGAVHNVLSRTKNEYKCTCAGASTYSLFKPKSKDQTGNKIDCVIIYWECPVLT